MCVQAETESDAKFHCISDFVAPRSSGVQDYVGMFAVTAGLGSRELCKRYF